MNRIRIAAVVALLVTSQSIAQQDSGVTEEVQVNLVYVEATVTDGKGNTVPDLGQDDFLLTVGGKAREIDVFDAGCVATPVPEPGANEKKNYRAQIAEPPTPRKIVFLFDYYTIPKPDRAMVLGFARYMLQQGRTPDEEVMIVALANGVRIEQRFTTDPRKLDSTLQRMEHDVTLYARDFLGVSGRPYFDNLERVMDVLAEYDGAKGIVMFSQWMGASDTHDLWFQGVTARAAAARARIYPVLTAGLQVGVSAGGPAGLARFANETGGETTFRTNDLSLGYARAQRDMACSYGIGFYVGKDEPRKPRRVTVRLAESGGRRVRGPEQIGLFDEKEQVENSLRAAMVDPGNFLNPYIRGHVVPIRPSSKTGWNTWIALHFRMKVSPDGNDLDVVATIKDEDHVQVRKFREQFKIRPTTDGSPQPVTIHGDTNLKPGSYTLTMAVNQVGNAIPQTTVVDLIIPEVPEGLILRGPVLAKALQEGVLIRTKKPDADAQKTLAVLQSIVGDDGSFQPLLIHQIDTDDTLLAYWEACSFDKKPPEGATVERRLVSKDGTALELDPIPLELTGKKVRCQRHLDTIAAGDAPEGSYRLEVSVKDAKGKQIALGVSPLRIASETN